MAQMNIVAYPYAQALFKLAKTANSQQEWLVNLEKLQQIIQEQQFIDLLNNPKITAAQIITLLQELLNGHSNLELANLLQVLTHNNRILALGEIYVLFKDLVLKDQNKSEVLIETAYPLAQAEQLVLEQLLAKKFNTSISAKVILNPTLMAGIKITINDKVIDGSIKGRLNDLATQLSK
jgi:F-type H+-transporting ATPase subunit delta